MLEIIDQGTISHRPGIGAYMPVITPLPDGTFVAAQHVGDGLGSPDNHVEILRSRDGVNWENHGSIHTDEHDLDTWTYRAPNISVTPDDRMVMTASRFEKKDHLFDPHTEDVVRCELVLLWSDDGGVAWSRPQVVPVPLPPDRYTWNGAGTLLQLAPDRWMYPLETWKPEGYAGPPGSEGRGRLLRRRGRIMGRVHRRGGRSDREDTLVGSDVLDPTGRSDLYAPMDPSLRYVEGFDESLGGF